MKTERMEFVNNERTGAYEAPKVEVLEVAIEKGFASSSIDGTAVDEDMDGGGGGSFGW